MSTAFFQAYFEADKVVHQLVIDELSAMITAEEITEEKAADKLRACLEAEVKPRKELAKLQGDIDAAQDQLSQWSEFTDSDDIAARVEASVWTEKWRNALEDAQAKHKQANYDLVPFVTATQTARNALLASQSKKRDLEVNKEYPFLGYGQDTSSYRNYRVLYGFLAPVALAGDESHPEWDMTRETVIRMCKCMGITEDDLKHPSPIPLQNLAALDIMKDGFRGTPQ